QAGADTLPALLVIAAPENEVTRWRAAFEKRANAIPALFLFGERGDIYIESFDLAAFIHAQHHLYFFGGQSELRLKPLEQFLLRPIALLRRDIEGRFHLDAVRCRKFHQPRIK